MLTVDIRINGRIVAYGSALNVSDGGDVSDYECSAISRPAEHLGIEHDGRRFRVRGHNRRQAAWALVAKIAAEMTALSQPATQSPRTTGSITTASAPAQGQPSRATPDVGA